MSTSHEVTTMKQSHSTIESLDKDYSGEIWFLALQHPAYRALMQEVIDSLSASNCILESMIKTGISDEDFNAFVKLQKINMDVMKAMRGN